MKKLVKSVLLIMLPVLIAANAFIFVRGITLSEDINKIDAATKKLQQQNIDLEAKGFKAGSLEFTASAAAALDFVANTTTLYLRDSGFAQR